MINIVTYFAIKALLKQYINTVANRIIEIVPNGMIDKITTYDEYLESDASARKRQKLEVNSEEDD